MTTTTDTAPAAVSPYPSALSTAVLLAELDEIRPLLSAPYLDRAERIEHAREFVALQAELGRRGISSAPMRYHGITPAKPPAVILDELQEASALLNLIIGAMHLEAIDDEMAEYSFVVTRQVADRLTSHGAASTDFEPDCDDEDGGDTEPDARRAPTFAEYVQQRPYESAWRIKSTSAAYKMSQTDYLMMHGMDRGSAISCVRRNSKLYK